jgi:hypothetical protein
LAVLVAVLLDASTHAQERALPASNESVQKVKELRKQRIAVLKELVAGLTELILHPILEEAYDPYGDALEARLLLLRAELDAAEKGAGRIALYLGAIDTLKKYQAGKKYEEGTDGEVTLVGVAGPVVLKTKARRLEVEIQLEQAKAEEAKEGTTPPRIKELQQERLATLKKLVDDLAQRVKTTPAEFGDLIEARRLLLLAELDTAENVSDRIALYKNAADALKEYEAWANGEVKDGRTTTVVALAVKASRLEAEIDWKRAQMKGGKPETAQQIKSLHKDRIATLEKLVDQAAEKFKNAFGPYEDVLEAQQLLLQARLDVAEKESDRIALYEKTVEVLKSREELAENQFAAARRTLDAVLMVQAQRLEVEMQLAQAKAKSKPKSE